MPLSGRPTNTTDRKITNDGFWPGLTVGDLTDKYRASTEYADPIVVEGLKYAITEANKDLFAAKFVMKAEGYDTLAAYAAAHSSQVDGEEVLHFYYVRAVCCCAKAFLLQNAQTLNRKPEAENAAKESPETQDYWLGQYQVAVNNLLGNALPDQSFDDTRYASVHLL